METVITNNATDSSQTGVSGEGCWDLWGYGVALCLSLACAISESKCSSFIYYSICFTPLFLFLFSHTPFSLSPLGGAVFIFGLLIFFSPSLSPLMTGEVLPSPCRPSNRSLSRRHVHVVLYMCFVINYWWISLFVFVDLFISESITTPPPCDAIMSIKDHHAT